MKICIDCRLYGPKNTGIGRYTENLIENLLKIDKENTYILLMKDDQAEEIKNLKAKYLSRIDNLKLKVIPSNIQHYSLREQVTLPMLIRKEKFDLVHFTHFNVPVFCKEKYVVTIHDLIKHTSRGGETTTRSPWLYWLKYLGYRIVFRLAVKRAKRIITPSLFVKNMLVAQYKVSPEKVAVTYEGVDDKLSIINYQLSKRKKVLEKFKIEKPFVLYVGSVYPHKNIENLIKAIKIFNQLIITDEQLSVALVIVCARNVFIQRLYKKIVQMRANSFVKLTGFITDEELKVLYKEAVAFVFPTLSEGFGLPGLEAMKAECPVVCSNIPVLKEIYGDAAIYFNPLDPQSIAEKIKMVLKEDKRKEMIRKGKKWVKKYSWSQMAKETLSVYQNTLDRK